MLTLALTLLALALGYALCGLVHRAARDAELATVEREVRTWRWLHWSHPGSAWACRCGDAQGPALDDCPVCGTTRPRKPGAATMDEPIRRYHG